MIDSGPMVSIIMNCHNSDVYLQEAIDSIYDQTFSDWELVFWDNGSTDRSAAIAKSYDSKVKYFFVEEVTPLGEARNLALKKATGRYVAFLDCDDIYLPEKLAKQVKQMESGGYAMSYGGAIVVNEFGCEKRRWRTYYESGDVFGGLLRRYEINMQSVILRRSILEENGLSFPIDYQFGPDYDLFMEIAARFRVGVLRDYIVKTRLHSGSLSRKTLHRVPVEIGATLNRIVSQNPEIEKNYLRPLKAAYQKLNYYRSVDLINKGLFKEARVVLRNIIFKKYEYMALYFLLLLPLEPNTVLRILKR